MSDLNILRTEPYYFKPMLCRAANIALQEAKFLRWLFLAERSNAEIMETFGMGMAYHLLKQGYADNPLGQKDGAQTNLWKLSADGLSILKKASGQVSGDDLLTTRNLQTAPPLLTESSTGIKS